MERFRLECGVGDKDLPAISRVVGPPPKVQVDFGVCLGSCSASGVGQAGIGHQVCGERSFLGRRVSVEMLVSMEDVMDFTSSSG